MLHEMLHDDQDHDGPAEGDRQVLRQAAAQERAEGQEAEALDPALVEIAPLVNAVQGDGQAPVQPQHGVAAEEVAGTGAVGLLEMVARNGVADLAQGEKSPLHDAVQQLLDQLLARDDFHAGSAAAGRLRRAWRRSWGESCRGGGPRPSWSPRQDFRKLPPLPFRNPHAEAAAAGRCEGAATRAPGAGWAVRGGSAAGPATGPTA